jgi:hypothetical protein
MSSCTIGALFLSANAVKYLVGILTLIGLALLVPGRATSGELPTSAN